MDAVEEYLTEVEEAAEDVLTTKQQIVDLDSKRNKNREALTALKTEMSDSNQEQLEKEINDLRKELKSKVNHLNEMQGNPELRGYNLSPLSTDEIKAMNSIFKI
ncbi:p53 and DNA damage-regulated protein 1 isoform X2 [Hippoglossus hippoglossus]|uniref:p53 and DNA damage-regulated protein 1 isoform X2 n=1 Tax=Hippoglossus hippoglossus TaxID=8267 RepID=UPI00148DBA4D|nr:p53 and DNA damage-regulated protein 1 isoform X2 [Hippoglossus hippoglossus]